MVSDRRRTPVPKGMSRTRGGRLWRDVLSTWELRPDEVVVLEAACRAVDMGDRILEALEGQPVMVPGSKGQLREHPLLAELRYQRALSAALLKQLGLPDDEVSDRARRAANERRRDL